MTPEERAANIDFSCACCNSPCPCEKMIAAAIREAVKERDFEWWEKLCLVDVVDPTPEGVRGFVDTMLKYHEETAVAEEREACAMLKYHEETAVAEEREACAQIVERDPPWSYDEYNAGDIAAEIRARKTNGD